VQGTVLLLTVYRVLWIQTAVNKGFVDIDVGGRGKCTGQDSVLWHAKQFN